MPESPADYSRLINGIDAPERVLQPLPNGNLLEIVCNPVETSRGLQFWPHCIQEIADDGRFVANASDRVEVRHCLKRFLIPGIA